MLLKSSVCLKKFTLRRFWRTPFEPKKNESRARSSVSSLSEFFDDLIRKRILFFKNFLLKRKRKRKITDFLNGTINGSPLSESFLSNTNLDMTTSLPLVHEPMPEVKRKRSLSRMTSAISTPMAKMTSVLQRSLSSAKLHGCPSPHKGTPSRYFYISHLPFYQAFFTLVVRIVIIVTYSVIKFYLHAIGAI